MGNKISISLLFLFLVCLVHSTKAAFPLKHVYANADSLLMPGSSAGLANQGGLRAGVSFLRQLVTRPYHGRQPHGTDPEDGRNGERALTWGAVGIIFWPLGAVAMYFGIRGWQRGRKEKGLAIAGFILGTIEILIVIFVVFLILLP